MEYMSSMPSDLAIKPGIHNAAADHFCLLRAKHCILCNATLPGKQLHYHSRVTGHTPFQCKLGGCGQLFTTFDERDTHQRRSHIEGHRRVEANYPFACLECQEWFSSKAKLRRHANEAQHSPFGCSCGEKFSRLDALNRHMDSLGTGVPKYPCEICDRHRGMKGFRRRDHLIQHIREYHKRKPEEISSILIVERGRHRPVPVCPHLGCPSHRGYSFFELHPNEQDKEKPFAKQSDYTKHMKDTHNETPFPCNVADCDRNGSRGYVSEKALIKHRKDKHPEASDYMPLPRDVTIRCRYCNLGLQPSSMYLYVFVKHSAYYEPAHRTHH
jgi:hypothetical protein